MKNKIIASTLGLMFLVPLAASAYTVPSPDFVAANVPDPSSFESHYDWATSLTEAQRESLKDMKKNMRTQIKADLKDATDAEKSEIKEALKAARQAMKDKRKAEFESLTEAQKEELKELRGGDHDRRFGKRGSFKKMSDEDRAARKAEFENMTDEEKAEHRAEMKEKHGERGKRHGKKRGFMKKFFDRDEEGESDFDGDKFESLSDSEKSEIKELRKSFMEKIRAYFK